MNRQPLADAVEQLSDEDYAHYAAVCHDIANRAQEGFIPLGVAARVALDIQESVEPVAEPALTDEGGR